MLAAQAPLGSPNHRAIPLDAWGKTSSRPPCKRCQRHVGLPATPGGRSKWVPDAGLPSARSAYRAGPRRARPCHCLKASHTAASAPHQPHRAPPNVARHGVVKNPKKPEKSRFRPPLPYTHQAHGGWAIRGRHRDRTQLYGCWLARTPMAHGRVHLKARESPAGLAELSRLLKSPAKPGKARWGVAKEPGKSPGTSQKA